jgi:small-conductance mechanosensitive channel
LGQIHDGGLVRRQDEGFVTLVERVFRRELADPSTPLGAAFYACLFLMVAFSLTRTLRLAVSRLEQSTEAGFVDRTAIGFMTQFAQAAVYVIAGILYAHLVPALRALGTAMLAGASVASIVVGLAAQSTLGNLIAGLGLLLYRPFRVGDRLQLNLPGGAETAVVEALTLGYTFLRAENQRQFVVPNSLMASQMTIHQPPEGANHGSGL